MLLNLNIKNYALIDDLRLEFCEGLNVFTGETGAGKSIIVESIKLLLGERASSDLIRKGSQNCLLSAEFDISAAKGLKGYLKESALEAEDDTIFLRREIDASGKSRSFVNDIPVSLKTLSVIGDYLVDVHGQHDHQSLFSSAAQRRLMDGFGGHEELLDEISKNYQLWAQLADKLNAQALSEEEKRRLIDIYSFQIKEIDSASLTPGEDEEIESKLPQLKNADKLKGFAQEAYSLLYEGEGAAVENLSKAQKLLDAMNSLGGGLGESSELLRNSIGTLEDAARSIESYKENLDSDPKELEKVLERQDLLRNLKKKYGPSVADIVSFRERIHAELETLMKSGQNRAEIEKETEKMHKALLGLCDELSARRKKCAKKLSESVEKELALLGMKKARFDVSFEKLSELTRDGSDKVEFMFQPNPGEELKALKDIASGGEISRVMLALKTVLAKADKIPVLIFDEIDTGIGGPMGQTIGKKLKDLSSHHQIICVTHLPQIAAFAKKNISVTKIISSSKTKINARVLSDEDRIEEIARMLSGEAISDSARKHAHELISNAQT